MWIYPYFVNPVRCFFSDKRKAVFRPYLARCELWANNANDSPGSLRLAHKLDYFGIFVAGIAEHPENVREKNPAKVQ